MCQARVNPFSIQSLVATQPSNCPSQSIEYHSIDTTSYNILRYSIFISSDKFVRKYDVVIYFVHNETLRSLIFASFSPTTEIRASRWSSFGKFSSSSHIYCMRYPSCWSRLLLLLSSFRVNIWLKR